MGSGGSKEQQTAEARQHQAKVNQSRRASVNVQNDGSSQVKPRSPKHLSKLGQSKSFTQCDVEGMGTHGNKTKKKRLESCSAEISAGQKPLRSGPVAFPAPSSSVIPAYKLQFSISEYKGQRLEQFAAKNTHSTKFVVTVFASRWQPPALHGTPIPRPRWTT